MTLKAAANAIKEFNFALIDALADVVPAIKPQAAYYEMYGYEGVRVLAETIAYAQSKHLFVITDGKRNDIGATMQAYATAHLGSVTVGTETLEPFGADALTVNGYLGTDGIRPLLDICAERDKGIFVLVKTSNPSSGELQDQKIGENTVYDVMGDMCETWGAEQIGASGYSAVGAVVGATYPEQLKELRVRLPHTFFLVPGYGAQGLAVLPVLPQRLTRMVLVQLSIPPWVMCAYQKEADCPAEDFAGAARREAIRMREDLCSHIQ